MVGGGGEFECRYCTWSAFLRIVIKQQFIHCTYTWYLYNLTILPSILALYLLWILFDIEYLYLPSAHCKAFYYNMIWMCEFTNTYDFYHVWKCHRTCVLYNPLDTGPIVQKNPFTWIYTNVCWTKGCNLPVIWKSAKRLFTK